MRCISLFCGVQEDLLPGSARPSLRSVVIAEMLHEGVVKDLLRCTLDSQIHRLQPAGRSAVRYDGTTFVATHESAEGLKESQEEDC